MHLSGAGQARFQDIADARHDWDPWRLADYYKVLPSMYKAALRSRPMSQLQYIRYMGHVGEFCVSEAWRHIEVREGWVKEMAADLPVHTVGRWKALRLGMNPQVGVL